MIKLITLIKAYNLDKESVKKAILYTLNNEFKNLSVEITNVKINDDFYTEIALNGEDEQIAANYIKKNYGIQQSISNIAVGDNLIGRLIMSKQINFGIFVDVGAITTREKIDALYPLYEIRKQLTNNNKLNIKNIVRAYGFIENLPLLFEIIEKQVIGNKLRVRLSDESINWLLQPFKDHKDALIVSGVSARMIKGALKRSRHSVDIELIEKIGILEYRLICKKGTRANGLIPEIGMFLNRAKIGAQIQSRILDVLNTP